MTSTAGKQTRRGLRLGFVVWLWCGLVCTPGCRREGSAPAVRPRDLEAAPLVALRERRRAVASDGVRNLPTYRPLGTRLGLLVIRDAAQWAALRALADELGPCPSIEQGVIVVAASHAGLPVDGGWPIRLRGVRGFGGFGLAVVRFSGGSYLSDDSTYLEAVSVRGVRGIVAVDVNGTRFYPTPCYRGARGAAGSP